MVERLTLVVFLALFPVLASSAAFGQAEKYKVGADQLAFSIDNMDPEIDPAEDFARYAAGGWLDRVKRPEQLSSIGAMDFMEIRKKSILKAVVEQAAAEAADAPEGSPTQQVGDYYKAIMNVEARNAAGIEPVREKLASIDAIETLDDLSAWLGAWALIVEQTPLFTLNTMVSPVDSSSYVEIAMDGKFGIAVDQVLMLPDDSPVKQAYLTFIREILTLGELPADAIDETAQMIAGLEAKLASGKLTAKELADPRNSNKFVPFDELQETVPGIGLTRYLDAMGLPVPDTVLTLQPKYFSVLAEVLDEYSVDDLKNYLKFSVLVTFKSVLDESFGEPTQKLNAAFTGVMSKTPMEEIALQGLSTQLNHPVSQLYVKAALTRETQKMALDMVGRVQSVFRKRIETRDWLSEATRKEALRKLDAFYYRVGYPDEWIDHSMVDVSPESAVENFINLATFKNKRSLARFGGPLVHDQFNNQNGTLPTMINAAYTPSLNGFEVTAAIVQPPVFDPEMDAAVNYCRLGATIGHEMLHGFDSGGRLFDADGNLNNWWTEEDSRAFEAEAQKLVNQANAYEHLPGKFVDGELTVKENMADAGGITLAHAALMDYLEEHPEEDVEVDGLTPSQRCFISWAQLWTEKSSDQYKLNKLTDGHAPNPYRVTAPLQHVDAFYEAFDINEGDPMWLPPEKRIRAW